MAHRAQQPGIGWCKLDRFGERGVRFIKAFERAQLGTELESMLDLSGSLGNRRFEPGMSQFAIAAVARKPAEFGKDIGTRRIKLQSVLAAAFRFIEPSQLPKIGCHLQL